MEKQSYAHMEEMTAANKHSMRSLVFVCIALFISSCTNSSRHSTELIPEIVCSFSNYENVLGLPISFDFVNDTTIVLAVDNRVLLYSDSGRFIRQIGRPGKALFEYNSPSLVRATEDSVYVWSSMSLQFISFGVDGAPGSIYPYDSALSDFDITDNLIVIYTAAKRGDHILDLYHKDDNRIETVGEATDEHRILCQNASVAPLLLKDDQILFASKDYPKIYELNCISGSVSEIAFFQSTSFNVNKLPTSISSMSRKEKSQYLKDNPFSLMILPVEADDYALMTLEGTTELEDDGVSNLNRTYDIYYGNDSNHLSIPWGIMKYWHLFSYRNGYLYYITNEIDGEDEEILLQRVKLL